ncbi:MAG: TonB family protein [Ghiorsea sp.]
MAFLAALGLHALLLISLSSAYLFEKVHEPVQAIEVSILRQNHTFPANTKESTLEKASQEKEKEKSEPIVAKPVVQKSIIEQENEASSQAKEPAAKTSEHDVITEQIQALILAKVSYPRRALRRGWQGETKLQFHIKQEVIQNINIHLSSGYSVLDKAAFKALASLHSLPLSDGNYLFPVIFRLQ